jgi:hypothetical protein
MNGAGFGNLQVVRNFLYIHNIELAFSQGVVAVLCIFGVLLLDWYEWN